MGPTAAVFFTTLYVDNVAITSWYTNPPLNPNYGIWVFDYSLGTLSAGTHIIKIVADSTNEIPESNELDNEYSKTITVTGAPNLAPYQPTGWSDKIRTARSQWMGLRTTPP